MGTTNVRVMTYCRVGATLNAQFSPNQRVTEWEGEKKIHQFLASHFTSAATVVLLILTT